MSDSKIYPDLLTRADLLKMAVDRRKSLPLTDTKLVVDVDRGLLIKR
jgi:hypothetical protein